MTPQEQVTEFHKTFGVAIDQSPSAALCKLRHRLIHEEATEVGDALQERDLAHIAQELADLAYVTYGTAVSLGIDLDAAVAEVHRANMSKLGPDGVPILREDGKVLKGPDYVPPDMSVAVLSNHRGDGGGDPVMTIGDSSAVWPITYTVSCLPLWHVDCDAFSITVEHRGGSYTDQAWAVLHHRWCLSSTGGWDFEPLPSGRDDRWVTKHRFYRDTALALARQHAPDLKVNGKTAADILAEARP